jgi:hypothetical protein
VTPTPSLTFVTMVATLAYLGLAVLGWGFAAFFSHPALVALAIALFVQSGAKTLWDLRGNPGLRLGHRAAEVAAARAELDREITQAALVIDVGRTGIQRDRRQFPKGCRNIVAEGEP